MQQKHRYNQTTKPDFFNALIRLVHFCLLPLALRYLSLLKPVCKNNTFYLCFFSPLSFVQFFTDWDTWEWTVTAQGEAGPISPPPPASRTQAWTGPWDPGGNAPLPSPGLCAATGTGLLRALRSSPEILQHIPQGGITKRHSALRGFKGPVG